MSIQEKGKSSIEAARRAHWHIQTATSSTGREGGLSAGVKTALDHLSSLREDGKMLKEAAQHTKQKQQERQKILLQQLADMDKKTQDTFTRLHRKKQQEESKLLKLQRSLEVSQNKLKVAEEQLKRARNDTMMKTKAAEASAAVMSSSGAVAVAVVGFNLSELIRLMLGHTLSSSSDEGAVQRATNSLKIQREEIRETKRKVALVMVSLCTLLKQMPDLPNNSSSFQATRKDLLSKISSAKSMMSFQCEVIEFWELFVRASSKESNAQYLKQFVQLAEEVRKVKVMRENTYTIEDMSFAEAWEEVTFKDGLVIDHELF